jgi:membrane protease YdiL (CAAX protease family)
MIFPSVMAWVYFEALAGPSGSPGEAAAANPAVLIAYYAAKVVQFSFPLLWVWRFERERLSFLSLDFRGVGPGIAFALVVSGAMLALYAGFLRGSSVLDGASDKLRAKLIDFHADTPGRFLALSLFIAAAHSLLEEYYYRWFLFSGLKDHLAPPAAVVISSLAFMGHHVIVLANYLRPGPVIVFSLCIAVGGAVWATIYHRKGSLLGPWLSHLLIDTAILIVGYDLAFGRP